MVGDGGTEIGREDDVSPEHSREQGLRLSPRAPNISETGREHQKVTSTLDAQVGGEPGKGGVLVVGKGEASRSSDGVLGIKSC